MIYILLQLWSTLYCLLLWQHGVRDVMRTHSIGLWLGNIWIGGCLGEVVAYERWSRTRGSNYRALTGKNLVFWIGVAYVTEMVAYKRWSHMEVRLYSVIPRTE